MTREQGDRIWAEIKDLWVQNNEHAIVQVLKDHGVALTDAGLATRVLADLGGYAKRARINRFPDGRAYIIFEGNHKLRSLLTGTRYKLTNPKIVSLGIGTAGAHSAAKTGSIVSLIIVSAYNVIDFILNDKTTLSVFLGNMAVDVGIVLAASAVAAAATAGLVAVGLITSVVVGPLIAVVAISTVVAIGLNWLANELKLKNKITEMLDAAYEMRLAEIRLAKNKVENRAVSVSVNIMEALADYAVGEVSDYLQRAIPRPFRGQDWRQF